MALHVGQRVVCVADRWDAHDGITTPKINAVYTIRSKEIAEDGTGDLFLKFVEIVNRPAHYSNGYHEASFDALGFRPVVERKTDIGIFRAMLTPSKIGVDA